MSAHLKFYLNGTPGGTDGTEIDPETTNLVSNGVNSTAYPYGGSYLELCVRCDAGFNATSVNIKMADNSYNMWSGCYNCTTLALYYTTSLGSAVKEINITTVKNINMLFLVFVSSATTANTASLFTVSFTEVAV